MFNSFFKRPKPKPVLISPIDVHSHLLPGIDDGVQTIDEAIEVIKCFHQLGFQKLITTPHIMSDFYKNTPEIINAKLAEVKRAIDDADIDIVIEAAAEYNLDEHFLDLITDNIPLLTFGDNYVLFELSFTIKPLHLQDAIFKLQTKGYRPVMAHTERYLYFHQDKISLQTLHNGGVLLQLNLISLLGYYSRQVKKMAHYLLKNGMVSLIGSDCHNISQFIGYRQALSVARPQYFENLLNNNL